MYIVVLLFYILFATYPLGELGKISILGQGLSLSTVVLVLLVYLFSVSLLCLPLAVSRKTLVPLSLLLALSFFDTMDLFRNPKAIVEMTEDFVALSLLVLTSFFVLFKSRTVIRGLQIMGTVLALGGIFAFIQALGFPLWSDIDKPLKYLPFRKIFYRTTGFPMDYGLYGIMNLSILPLALISMGSKNGLYRSRLMGIMVSLLLLLAIVISQDRSMWLATGVVLGSLGLGYTLSWRRKHPFLFVLFFSAFILVAGVGTALALKVAPLLYESNVSSIRQRLEQYTFALGLIRSHPLTGIGNGRFPEIYHPTPTPANPHPSPMLHNYFLNEAVSTGVISACALLTLCIWTTFRFLHVFAKSYSLKRKHLSIAFLSAWLGMLVELLFYPGSSGLKIIWIYIGIAANIERILDEWTVKGAER